MLGNYSTYARCCPFCYSTPSSADRKVVERDGWRAVACRTCDFVYMPEVPVLAHLVDDLAWEKQFALERDERLSRTPLLERLDRVLRWRHRILPRTQPRAVARRYVSGGNILDIGCGTGSYAADFAPDFTPFGIKISRGLAHDADRLLTPLGGTCVHASGASGLGRFEDEFFSVVLLRSYLEHEPTPNEVLAQVFRVLRTGGVVIVKVPNHASLNRRLVGTKWCGFRLPDHVNYFTPRSLAAIGARHGFSVSMPPHWRLPTDDNMWAVFVKRKPSEESVRYRQARKARSNFIEETQN